MYGKDKCGKEVEKSMREEIEVLYSEEEIEKKLEKLNENYKEMKLEEIKIIDPCMGSGHILVYAFDVLMDIYSNLGYSNRDAVQSILENNIYDIYCRNSFSSFVYWYFSIFSN